MDKAINAMGQNPFMKILLMVSFAAMQSCSIHTCPTYQSNNQAQARIVILKNKKYKNGYSIIKR